MIRLARVRALAGNKALCINSLGKDPVNLLTGANALVLRCAFAGGYQIYPNKILQYCSKFKPE